MGILRIYQVGEKFQAWTDVDPTMDDLLTNLTLWWLTDTYSTSIYPYRHVRKCVLTFVTRTDSTRLPPLSSALGVPRTQSGSVSQEYLGSTLQRN